MKKLFLILVTLLMLFSVVGCSRVEAGTVGIKVNLLGSEKGVDSEVLGVGRYWIGMNEELYLFPTFQQNVIWTQSKTEGSPNDDSITFQTVEGASINADIGVTYSVNPDMVTTLFQKYRKGIDEISNVFLRNEIRNSFNTSASTRTAEEIYGTGKANFINEVQTNVTNKMKEVGIIIESVYFVGSLRLPSNILNAINSKVEATQRATQRENELREAEAEKAIALTQSSAKAESLLLEAEAQSKANKLLEQSLTPEIIQAKTIEKWDGVLPKITSDTIPMINVQ